MKDYRLFDISDFVMDDDFIRWVSQGRKADNDFWDNWLSCHSDKHMIVAEARRILELIGTEELVSNEIEKQNEINKLLRTIKEQSYEMHSSVADARSKVISLSKKWWYAAAIVLISSLGIYLFSHRNRGFEKYAYAAVTSSKHLIENINTSEKAITLRLPDESTVELAPNSRISYSNNFDSNSTRDIYLSGQAFFTVTKNPARPFRVFANEIVTKVLGTGFSVRCYERDTVIQIRVRIGKVSIYSQTADAKETGSPNHLGGIILTPNQELVYKRSNREFQKTLLENPVTILPDVIDQKNMLYEEASLEKVFNQLSKMYGINIVYDNEVLKKCTLTADLRNETFYRKLELICKAIGAHYEVMDGQVVVQSNGCE